MEKYTLLERRVIKHVKRVTTELREKGIKGTPTRIHWPEEGVVIHLEWTGIVIDFGTHRQTIPC